MGDRCEGKYRQPISGSLTLLSLTEGRVRRGESASEELRISWPGNLVVGKLAIEARVLEARTYYRMDKMPSAESDSYVWSLKEMRASGYERQQIGLRATGEVRPDLATGRTLIPLRVGTPAAPSREAGGVPDSYWLQFVSNDQVDKVYVTLFDRVGGEVRKIWKNQPLKGDAWAPEHPILVEVPRQGKGRPGIYRLTVVVDGPSGSSPLTVEFVHD